MTDETHRKSHLDHLRRRLAWVIMPDEEIQRREDAEFKVERLINEMHFKISVVAGYRKGIEDAGGSASDYRVEDDLR